MLELVTIVCEKKKKKAMGCQGILPGMNAVLLAVSTRCLITKYLNNESLSKAQRRAAGIPLSSWWCCLEVVLWDPLHQLLVPRI